MPLTEKQHAKAAELSADVLKKRRDLDAMQDEIKDMEEKLLMARDCRIKAILEYEAQVGSLNSLLLVQE